MAKNTDNHRVETLALHAGAFPDPTTGAILTPIYQSTTYRQAAVGRRGQIRRLPGAIGAIPRPPEPVIKGLVPLPTIHCW